MKSIYSQVFLKLRHESKVEHIFALESSAGKYKVLLVKFVFVYIFILFLFFILQSTYLLFSLHFDEIFKVLSYVNCLMWTQGAGNCIWGKWKIVNEKKIR